MCIRDSSCVAQILPDGASEQLRRHVSMELSADANTPPAFIWHTTPDTGVPCENSINYALRLRQLGIPFQLHLYDRCNHGIGLAENHPWTRECLQFLSLV